MNALWWLARGPYDALDAAKQSDEAYRPSIVYTFYYYIYI